MIALVNSAMKQVGQGKGRGQVFKSMVKVVASGQKTNPHTVVLTENTAKGRAVAHLYDVKRTLEGQGYDVTVRLKTDPDLKNYITTQTSVSWKGMPLLVANRRVDGANVKLMLASGMQAKGLDNRQTAHGAYNDFMWAEMESLSRLGLPVEVSLEGEGSHKWFMDNVQGCENLKRGNKLQLAFFGAKANIVIQSNEEHSNLEKEATKNVSAWENPTPQYNPVFEPGEHDKLYETEVWAGTYEQSTAARQLLEPNKGIEPGWT